MFHFRFGIPRPQAYYYEGTGPQLLDDIRCEGNETDIRDCPASHAPNCLPREDVGVECYD